MSLTRPLTLALCGLLLGAPAASAQPEALDLSFNGTGYVVRPVNTGDNMQKLLVQPDEKIVAVGMSFDATFTARAHVLRFNPDGTPDTDFATDGLFTFELDNEALLYSGALTPEGKILLVGATTDYQTYRMLLIQLNADGTLDETFGNAGSVDQAVTLAPNNGEDFAYDVAFDAEGNILVCGNSYSDTYVRRPVVVRF
ncbi:MAG: delta-60 repeat domain-containing protein, partial [Flavobacteriales bacterium]